MSMLVAICDAHVKGMRKAVCGSSASTRISNILGYVYTGQKHDTKGKMRRYGAVLCVEHNDTTFMVISWIMVA